MNRVITPMLAFYFLVAPLALGRAGEPPADGGAVQPVDFASVRIQDAFWTPRIETIQKVTIPDLFDLLESQGKIDNLRIIAGRKKDGRIRSYNSPDSDIWKIMEAASYTLAWRQDAELDGKLDELIELYAEAQADDGYINQMFMLPDDHPQSPENAAHVFSPDRRTQADGAVAYRTGHGAFSRTSNGRSPIGFPGTLAGPHLAGVDDRTPTCGYV